jgi:hypothetical protein
MSTDVQMKRRLRGVILRLISQNHERQQHRLDDITLTGVLERLQYDVYVDLVRTTLQDLGERGLLEFAEDRNRRTGENFIRKIQITPRGRDLVEGTISDPAIDVNE